MSANTVPIFPNVANVGQGSLTTANTNRDGSGTLVTVFTAGSNGSILDWIHFEGQTTTSSSIITIFVKQSSTYTLIGEVAVTAVTPSTTVAAFSSDWQPYRNLVLPSGATVVCGITVGSQTVHATAIGENF